MFHRPEEDNSTDYARGNVESDHIFIHVCPLLTGLWK
jgi:hypothetical protein